MAHSSAMVKPERRELLQLEVLATEQVSPHFRRVSVGGRDIDRFVPMGFDQWFRLFLPTGSADALDRIPPKANEMLGYLRFLAMGDRPLMRNYTARAYRPDGPDGPTIDIDFVVHGPTEDATASAAAWAMHCAPGDRIAIIDEGIGFNPERGVDDVLLVADETALPAVNGILTSLPQQARGIAWCEVPDPEDQIQIDGPAGVELRYLVRGEHEIPGHALLRTVLGTEATGHVFLAGEQGLVSGVRRDLVSRGVPTDQISFCSYWKLPKNRRVA